MSKIKYLENRYNGQLVNAESVTLASQDGTYGIKRVLDNHIVVGSNTPVLNPSIGRYEYDAQLCAFDIEYEISWKIVFNGQTVYETSKFTFNSGSLPDYATSFEDIYSSFLSDVTDYDMSDKMSEDTFYYTLYEYLKKSIVMFKKCRQDLSDIIAPDINTQGYFNFKLTAEEIYILALGMKIAWLNPKIYKSQLLKNTFDTKDLRTFSNGNLLKELTALKKITETDLDNAISDYSYDDFKGFC